jgi:UrcA family protein
MFKHPLAVLFALALGVGAFVAGSPATAASQGQANSIIVRSNGLDLNDPSGARAMLSRIRHAAEGVCTEATDQGRCIRGRMDDALARLGDPRVTAADHGR